MILPTAMFTVLLMEGGVPAWIAKSFNLIVFFGILYYLVRKPLHQFFAERFATVRRTLEHAAREKERAETKMSELEARYQRLDTELNEIRTMTQKEAALERQRLETETARDIEKLREIAQREIESSKQVALADLREFAAAKAVDLAEEIIRRELTAEDDAQLLARVGEEMRKVQ